MKTEEWILIQRGFHKFVVGQIIGTNNLDLHIHTRGQSGRPDYAPVTPYHEAQALTRELTRFEAMHALGLLSAYHELPESYRPEYKPPEPTPKPPKKKKANPDEIL